jgi:general stress protein YciG
MLLVMASKKNAAAVELGRRGGKKKVAKGFSKMNPDRRAEIGRQGANARWVKKKGEGKV